MTDKTKEIRIDFPRELLGGVYSNNAAVAFTREEFILDFLMVAPPSGAVTARVILNPGHVKRIVKTLQENIGRYEEKFGPIQAFEAPPPGKVTIQ